MFFLKFQMLKMIYFFPGWAIRKVKAVSPSPFYDGTYHPSLFKQLSLLYILKYSCKV